MKAKSVITIAVGAMLLRNSHLTFANLDMELIEPVSIITAGTLYERAPIEFPKPIQEENIEEPEEPEIQTYITDSPYFNDEGLLNTEYRQTYYSVQEGEVLLGSGLNNKSKDVKSINNVMHYNDTEFGWIPIYALNMDVVTNSGQDSRGTWNMYGSVIEVSNENGDSWLGYVGDACGACRKAKKIDLWVVNNDQSLDVDNINFRFIRYGEDQYLNGDESNENR